MDKDITKLGMLTVTYKVHEAVRTISFGWPSQLELSIHNIKIVLTYMLNLSVDQLIDFVTTEIIEVKDV